MKQLAAAVVLSLAPLCHAADVVIISLPATPLIERTKSGQALNFDLLLENKTDAAREIVEIEATILGAADALVAQRRVARNGQSILTIPNRTLPAKGKLVVFNPFAEFDDDIELRTIRYEIEFKDAPSATITVRPRVYETKTDLIPPVRGRLFVHDGHDLLSHHRRLDITGGMTTALKIDENMMRYAYDFVVIDEKGAMQGMGAEIVAPGAGVVVAAAGDREDGDARPPLKFEDVLKDITLMYGNYVIVDHENGEVSVLAHLKKGSVTVKAGDRVAQGAVIGAVGQSGDAMFPHLHYQLQRDARLGEGLPSSFRRFRRFTGSKFVDVARGHVDSGDVIESRR